MWKLYNLLLASTLAFNVAAYAQTDSLIEAKVDKNSVQTGETFKYTLKIEGQFVSPKIQLPVFEDFTVVSTGQQRQYASKNNGTFLTLQANYSLLAINPGTFTIKGAAVIDGGKKIEAKPLVIEVTGKPLEKKSKIKPYTGKGVDL